MTGERPLLLVGHGTRSTRGVAEFGKLVARVRDRGHPHVPAVYGGFIELARPSVGEVVARMAASVREAAPALSGAAPATRGGLGTLRLAGPRWEVVALPLVLTAAGHGKGDIPAALARSRAHHPGLSWRYGRPLGPHPVLQDVLADRVDAALAGDARAGTHVVLVGRGSTDPDANAEVAKVARLLWEGRGFQAVEFGFISLALPSVPAALERVRLLGARRVVVAPYFLFPGALPDRVARQSQDFAAAHREMDVRVAGLIGDCGELAGLVLERYAEAVAGDIRMNCDTCAYRMALPGFADKLGRPQTPHYHPDDGPHDHAHAEQSPEVLP